MTLHVRLALFGALAALLMIVSLIAPIGTPAQSEDSGTPVPGTSTAVPPTETPTSEPTETAVPTEPPAEAAPNTPIPTPTAKPPPISAANHTASISPSRVTVNSWVTFTLANYPANATVDILWRRNTGSVFQFATTTTDATGAASGRFRVPAVTGGPNQIIAFTSGDVTKRVTIEVRPRIKVLTNPAMCGEAANVSLRGYAKKENVRIRWKVGDTWQQVGTVLTSNTGSANISVIVPEDAAAGANSVRGDGTVFRQQTNVAFVECGEPTPTAVVVVAQS